MDTRDGERHETIKNGLRDDGAGIGSAATTPVSTASASTPPDARTQATTDGTGATGVRGFYERAMNRRAGAARENPTMRGSDQGEHGMFGYGPRDPGDRNGSIQNRNSEYDRERTPHGGTFDRDRSYGMNDRSGMGGYGGPTGGYGAATGGYGAAAGGYARDRSTPGGAMGGYERERGRAMMDRDRSAPGGYGEREPGYAAYDRERGALTGYERSQGHARWTEADRGTGYGATSRYGEYDRERGYGGAQGYERGYERTMSYAAPPRGTEWERSSQEAWDRNPAWRSAEWERGRGVLPDRDRGMLRDDRVRGEVSGRAYGELDEGAVPQRSATAHDWHEPRERGQRTETMAGRDWTEDRWRSGR